MGSHEGADPSQPARRLVTVFIDTAIVMYAAGADHPLRDPCRRIIDQISDGSLDAVTSTEVIQEILHRFVSSGRPNRARR